MWRKHGNRVQRNRFPCTEIEFIELGFLVWKTSSLNSISIELVFIELGRWTFIELGRWKTSLATSAEDLIKSCSESLLLGLLDQITKSSAIRSSAEDGPYQIVFLSDRAHQIVLRDLVVGKSISCGYMIMENEFNELVFHTWKSSSLNSVSVHGNRVR